MSTPIAQRAAGEPAAELAAPERTGRRGASIVHRLVVVRELGILAALVLLIGITLIANPRFLSGQNVRDLMLSAARARALPRKRPPAWSSSRNAGISRQ